MTMMKYTATFLAAALSLSACAEGAYQSRSGGTTVITNGAGYKLGYVERYGVPSGDTLGIPQGPGNLGKVYASLSPRQQAIVDRYIDNGGTMASALRDPRIVPPAEAN